MLEGYPGKAKMTQKISNSGEARSVVGPLRSRPAIHAQAVAVDWSAVSSVSVLTAARRMTEAPGLSKRHTVSTYTTIPK
jgi:hypothetical protein